MAPAVDRGRALRLFATVSTGAVLGGISRLTDPLGWLVGACIAAAVFVALAQQTLP